MKVKILTLSGELIYLEKSCLDNRKRYDVKIRLNDNAIVVYSHVEESQIEFIPYEK